MNASIERQITSSAASRKPFVDKAMAAVSRAFVEVSVLPAPDKPRLQSDFLASGMTIHAAVQSSNFAGTVLLLMMTAPDVDVRDGNGFTPLHFAAQQEDGEIVAFLLAAGANLEARNSLQQTPLMLACTGAGHISVVSYLLDKGADINARDIRGNSVLLTAVQNSHLWLAHYLISRGADSSAKDNDGHQCLQWAAFVGSVQMVRYFAVYHNQDVNQVDKRRRTGLHWAARQNHAETCRLLRQLGASTSVLCDENYTPAQQAAQQGNDDLAAELAQPLQRTAGSSGRDFFRFWSQADIPTIMLGSYFPALLFGSIVLHWFFLLMLTGLAVHHGRTIVFYQQNMKRPIGNLMIAFWCGCTATFCIGAFIYIDVGLLYAPTWAWLTVITFTGHCVSWYLCNCADPGVIPPARTKGEMEEMFALVAATGTQPSPDDWCPTCLVRRPIRSKHCGECGQCVARFDHHCVWINGDVGWTNHRLFMLFLFFHVASLLCWIVLSVKVCLAEYAEARLLDVSSGDFTFVGFLSYCFSRRPFFLYTFLFACIILVWLASLTTYQMKLISDNLTTNEIINMSRYKHFMDGGKRINPFHLGARSNILEFFRLGPVVRDWSSHRLPSPEERQLLPNQMDLMA